MLSDEELAELTGEAGGWRMRPAGGGFQGSHFLLEAAGSRWFVKAQPPGSAGRFYDRSGAFVKEPAVYSRLLPALEPHIQREEKLWPAVSLSRKGAIVLEDVTVSGWSLCPTRPTGGELRAALEALADLHAASMRLELEAGSLLTRYPDLLEESYFGSAPGHPGMETWRSFTATAAEIYRRHFPDRAWDRAISWMEKAPELARPSQQFRNCLCHGDPWQNNMFLKYHNGVARWACLVDWAQVRYCPPSLEVLLFLRHLQLEDLRPGLEHYWRRLVAGVPDYPRSEFDRSAASLGEPFALCLAPLYIYLTRLPTKALEAVTVSQEAFWAFATGEDKPALEALDTDTEYRTAVLRAFRELLDLAEGDGALH